MIAKNISERVLLCAMSTGADFVELFAETTRTSSISLADKKIDAIRDNTISGVGIRAFVGTKTIFASTCDTSEKGLMNCAKAIAEAVGETQNISTSITLTERIFTNVHPIKIVPSDSHIARKVDLLKWQAMPPCNMINI